MPSKVKATARDAETKTYDIQQNIYQQLVVTLLSF